MLEKSGVYEPILINFVINGCKSKTVLFDSVQMVVEKGLPYLFKDHEIYYFKLRSVGPFHSLLFQNHIQMWKCYLNLYSLKCFKLSSSFSPGQKYFFSFEIYLIFFLFSGFDSIYVIHYIIFFKYRAQIFLAKDKYFSILFL